MNRPEPGAAGFTLIELMVVIGILSLLIVAFVPDLIGARQGASAAETEARLRSLQVGIDAFARQRGFVPPDDLKDPEDKVKVRADNGINTGIESLVVFLCQARGGIDLAENEAWLANTDKDDNGAPIPLLSRSSRMEVVDAWGTPLGYFSATSNGFDKPQRIQPPEEGPEQQARAHKNAEGVHVGARRFQLVSAGADLAFNTDDDITVPERR